MQNKSYKTHFTHFPLPCFDLGLAVVEDLGSTIGGPDSGAEVDDWLESITDSDAVAAAAMAARVLGAETGLKAVAVTGLDETGAIE